MRKILFALLVSFCWGNVSSNENLPDSLIHYKNEKDASKKISYYLELSDKNKNNFDLSITYLQAASYISSKINNNKLLQKSEFKTGFVYYSNNQYPKAIFHFNKSLELSKIIYNKEAEALSLNRLGNVYQLMGKYNDALTKYEEAIAINRFLNNDQELARTLTNIGSVYRLYGNYEDAINQHFDALDIYEELNDSEGIAWSALNIGRLFKMMKNYQKSIEYVNKSLSIYKKIKKSGKPTTGVTLCLKEKGSIYYQMGNLEQAVKYSEEVLLINKQNKNYFGVANTLSSLGMVYFNAREYSKAKNYLIKSVHLKDSLKDNTGKASILRYLGRICMTQGNLSKATKNLQNSLKYALEQNLKEDEKEAYLSLSYLNERTGNKGKALEYFKKYTTLKERLNNQKINELELQYEFDKKQRQIEFSQQQREIEQKAKLQKQKIFTWVFVGGFLLMIIIAYLIFKGYQRKKKTNGILRKQKQEIEEQRDEIEVQRDFVTKQRDQISHQNSIITDSIEYAKRIQTALFPQDKFMNQVLGEYFVFMKPRNIVSGDFYWLAEKNNKTIVTVADCTGHGVPGAFMSMLGITLLTEIVNQNEELHADQILETLRKNIIELLHQEYGVRGSKDGMDIALCIIDKDTLEMQYAGAYNPAYIIRNKEILELKADKMPIGIYAIRSDKKFQKVNFKLQKDDLIYLFSDGYVDQFGGEKTCKFKPKAFKNLLLDIYTLPMSEQKEQLEQTMEQWQGEQSQLDDMMIMGMRI